MSKLPTSFWIAATVHVGDLQHVHREVRDFPWLLLHLFTVGAVVLMLCVLWELLTVLMVISSSSQLPASAPNELLVILMAAVIGVGILLM